jgi:transposase
MQHIQGTNRQQTYFSTLEQQVAADNPVRIVDAFVNKLDLQKLGFSQTILKSEGGPPYAPALLLKLYLYGYLNKIRSSRKLEQQCSRNIELRWLMQELCPNYRVLSFFANPQFITGLVKNYILQKDFEVEDG